MNRTNRTSTGSAILSTLLVFLLLPALGAAQHFVDGTAGVTAVSGERGKYQQELGASPLAVHGFAWSESADNPCLFRLLTRNLTDGREVEFGPEFTGFDCPKPLPGAIPPFPYAEVASFHENPRFFVRGVAVCNNNRNNERMKGIRVYPAKVWATKARVDELGKRDAHEHDLAHCRTWGKPVFCPTGKVAFGAVVHYEVTGITGLALRCKEVRW